MDREWDSRIIKTILNEANIRLRLS
jgi:hypothetical protein